MCDRMIAFVSVFDGSISKIINGWFLSRGRRLYDQEYSSNVER